MPRRRLVERSDLRLLKPLGVKERLSFDKRVWKKTHYFLYATDQCEAVPEDTEHHSTMDWFPINRLPDMFWPEQRKLVEATAREIDQSVVETADRPGE